jgi:ABC-2 type transport system permease protein
MTRIEAVFRKEVTELLSNRALVFSFLGLVLLFVILPIGLVAVLVSAPADVGKDEANEAVKQLTRLVPELKDMSTAEQGAVLVIRHFTLIFLILPVIGALGSSTSSIVGEKQSRSIEPVLATPVTTFELLVGKSFGTVALAVSGTWAGFLLYVSLVHMLVGNSLISVAFDLTTLMIVFILTPLIALLGLGAGVVISSRVSDSRSAQQIGGLLILPIVFLIVGQITGLFILGPLSIVVAALVMLVLDFAVLRLGVRLFDRERIVSEWK